MTQRGRAAGRPSAGARRGGAPERGGRGGAAERAGQARGTDAPRADLAARRARLRAVVEPVVAAAGYDLEDLTLSRAGRRHLVRVIVDADGGVGLDAIAEVSRAVSGALDAAEETGGELLAGEYQLEVSSPGVDRPLTLPRHWRRNIGRLVRVTAGDRQLTGRVVGADDTGVGLDVDGTSHEVPYARLGPGRVQVEFSRVDDAEFDGTGLDDDAGFDDGTGPDDDAGFDDGTGPDGDAGLDGGTGPDNDDDAMLNDDEDGKDEER